MKARYVAVALIAPVVEAWPEKNESWRSVLEHPGEPGGTSPHCA
jgi:hypothetical protein